MTDATTTGRSEDRPLQAIIFDFDGVIANSEPLHLQAFQQALAEEGIELTGREYYARYLGYPDPARPGQYRVQRVANKSYIRDSAHQTSQRRRGLA